MAQPAPIRTFRQRWLLLACLALASAGALGAEQKARDPLEKLNRATYAFNDAMDRMLVRPLAKGYKRVTPQPVRSAFSNFLANLYYPSTAVNQFLQGKIKYGFEDGARFFINSTIGVGGFFDPATKMGLLAHDEDLGQTLGVWGVPAGPYIVLPLFGPSDLRDGPANYFDTYAQVPHYYPRPWRVRGELLTRGAYGLDQRAQLVGADEAINSAFDPYALLRDTYVRHREYLVRDGKVKPQPVDDDLVPAPDEPGATEKSNASPLPPAPPTPSYAPKPLPDVPPPVTEKAPPADEWLRPEAPNGH